MIRKQVQILILILGFVFMSLFFVANPSCYSDCFAFAKNYWRKKNTEQQLWNKGFQEVEIKSTLDQKIQKAYFYASKITKPAPLIISLHTWSGNYQEFDSIAILSKQKQINYIHPDFRGANSSPDACNSSKALRDIDDAIDFAIKHAKVDENEIYIMGKSGGGFAALGVFMKSKHKINMVSSWVPISHISKWYAEGKSKNSRYIDDILKCTSSKEGVLNKKIAKKKSPLFMTTPLKKRRNTELNIYTGINDGLKGSVQITHSIDFYNKVISDFGAVDSLNYVTQSERQFLVERRAALGSFKKIDNRQVLLKKQYQNIKLVVFQGHHEMLSKYAFSTILNR